MNRDQPPPATDTTGQPSWTAPVQPAVPDHELIRRIGGGSYGDVWLARNVVGTWRAVKVVFRDRFTDARPYEREFNGIQKFEPLSRSNEGFIDILQIGRNDEAGYFYYVMELADDAGTARDSNQSLVISNQSVVPEARPPLTTDNCSLITGLDPSTYVPLTLSKSLLLRGRLPVSECLELGLTLNLALAHLHRAGLIHRDIKPSNIIFVGGVPKLADIGLVIETSEARSYVGTEGFIPPEGPTSPQADLYSLGKVLYEAGMGKDRKDFPEPMTQIAEVADSAQLLEFNAILLKACAANVRERYQSAEEMNADLALLQSGGSVRRQRKLAGQLRFVQRAGVAVTAIAAIIATGWWWQARQTHLVRELVVEKGKLAEKNREQLVRLRVANGVRLLDDGDPSAALLWFAEALPLLASQPAEDTIHRIRIQQVLDKFPRLLQVMAHPEGVRCGAFSPDGNLMAIADWQRVEGITVRTVRLWNAKTGTLHSDPIEWRNAAYHLRFSQDSRRIFGRSFKDEAYPGRSTDGQGSAVVFDLSKRRALFPAITNAVTAVFSSDDLWLAVARTNFTIDLFETATGRLVTTLAGHTNQITMLTFSRNGDLLASASLDRSVRLWRTPSGEPAEPPLLHAREVWRVVFSPDGRRVATAEDAQNGLVPVHTWDWKNRREVGPEIQAEWSVWALTFDATNGRVLIVADAQHLTFFDAETHELAFKGGRHEFSPVRCWAFSPDGIQFAAGKDGFMAQVWSLETGEPLTPLLPHSGYVESVSFSPDGNRLLTTSDDGTAKSWSLVLEHESERMKIGANFSTGEASIWDTIPRGRTLGPIAFNLSDGRLHLVDPVSLHEETEFRPQELGHEFHMWTAARNGRIWAIVEGKDDSDSQQGRRIKMPTGVEGRRGPTRR